MYPMAPNVSTFNNSNLNAVLANTDPRNGAAQIPPYGYCAHQQIWPMGQTTVLFGAPHSLAQPSGSLNQYSHLASSPLSPNVGISSWVVNDDIVYRCNIIAQLQGSYLVETPAGQAQVSVILPSKNDGVEVKSYAMVRRSGVDGEAMPDMIIKEAAHRFVLCSMDGTLEAYMMKGSNMKCSVSWEVAGGGAPIVWQRKGDVTFNLVQLQPPNTSWTKSVETIAPLMPNPRPGETSSTGTCGSSSTSVYNSNPRGQDSQDYISTDGPVRAPNDNPCSCGTTASSATSPTDEGWPDNSNHPSGGSDARSAPASLENSVSSATDFTRAEQKQAIVELIKAHCVRKSSLLKKLVHWGLRTAASPRVVSKIADNVCKGRLWLAAFPVEGNTEILDDIKGAYREVYEGLWKQPEPRAGEPGVQHRLLKGRGGHWKIESQDSVYGGWQLCVQELPDGRWLKNNGEEIKVYLISMSTILLKLGETHTVTTQEVERGMEFLFKSCNQKKLNSKLKGSNLKHNIDNLKLKLEKQYSLSFAVEVSSVANAIAREL